MLQDLPYNWSKWANKLLKGHTIVQVRYMTQQEADTFEWYARTLIIELSNGAMLYATEDHEGSSAGAWLGHGPPPATKKLSFVKLAKQSTPTSKNEQQATQKAKSILVGRKVDLVRYLTNDERDELNWITRPVVLQLDDGSVMLPVGDLEDGYPGTLLGKEPQGEVWKTFPDIM